MFADAVCGLLIGSAHVTLDLSAVTFMAVDGISALHAIRAQLMRTESSWEYIPSGAVARVLRLCDPAGLFAVAEAPQTQRIAG